MLFDDVTRLHHRYADARDSCNEALDLSPGNSKGLHVFAIFFCAFMSAVGDSSSMMSDSTYC
jgi:hypothetical protein